MSIVSKICKRARTLLQNPKENNDFIISHLEIVADDLDNRLQAFGLKYETEVVVLPAVAAQTTSLITLQAEGQPLETMTTPVKLEWKLAGRSVQEYREVPATDELSDTDGGSGLTGVAIQSNNPTVASWEWRKGNLYISPCSQSVDLRLRYYGLPQVANNDAATIAPRGAMNLLVYLVCISIVATDGGPGAARVKYFSALLTQALADYQAIQIKAAQKIPLRLGGMRQSNYRGFTPPMDGGGGSSGSGGSGGSGGGGGTGGTVLKKARLLGVQDNNNKIFLISPLPASGSDPIIYSQGVTLKTPLSYTYFSGVVTFVTAPAPLDELDAAVMA